MNWIGHVARHPACALNSNKLLSYSFLGKRLNRLLIEIFGTSYRLDAYGSYEVIQPLTVAVLLDRAAGAIFRAYTVQWCSPRNIMTMKQKNIFTKKLLDW